VLCCWNVFLVLERLDPSRPSSKLTGEFANPVTMGEYGLAAFGGANDETWSNMTDSSVAFVREIMFARRTGGKECLIPWALKTLHSDITV
jgi:uncharacterized membrane protein